ncbi:MAG: PH domain-containing protein [Pirellulaceae bacterium]
MDPAEQIRDRQTEAAAIDEPERQLWAGNYSVKAMFGWYILAGLISLLLLFGAVISGASETGWLVVLILILMMWAGSVGTAYYRKFSDQYVLTTQRLKHRRGIFFRKNNRIELIDIDDVMFEQGPIQVALEVGDIRVTSSDASHPELNLVGMADVRNVADLIDDARRAERRKRGLHIEAI